MRNFGEMFAVCMFPKSVLTLHDSRPALPGSGYIGIGSKRAPLPEGMKKLKIKAVQGRLGRGMLTNRYTDAHF